MHYSTVHYGAKSMNCLPTNDFFFSELQSGEFDSCRIVFVLCWSISASNKKLEKKHYPVAKPKKK